MEPMKKPEWFELTENDGEKPRRDVKRGARAFVLTIPLLAIGAGVVFAQTSQDAPATTEVISVAQSKPSIATPPLPPTYSDDDDDFDDFEDDHDEDEEDDEDEGDDD
jgi:hypothetical protein